MTYWVCLGVLEQGLAGGQPVYSTVDTYIDRRKETQRHQPVTHTGEDEGITILQKSAGLSSFAPRPQANDKSEEERMLCSFVMNILRPSPAQQEQGKSLEKIYSALNNMYMQGQGLKEEKVKEVLQQMVIENKISFVSNKYVLT